ncbi:hypothetical protein SLS62_008897 [Diatrype stigma]|uniref:Uncharacterized protein n=1 Tax=Diatrype stigma TaxID=117547 RepID=A0AAN9YJT2_9PEZI
MLLRQLQRPLARSVAPAVWPRVSPPAFAGRLLLHGSSGDSNHNDTPPPRDHDENNYTTQRDENQRQQEQQPTSSETETGKPRLYDELFPEAKNNPRSPPLDDTQHSRWASQILEEPPPVLDVPEGLDVDGEQPDTPVPQAKSMLVLSATSKNLVESDFLRLGVRGRHVEGWVSGILKVVQARDPDTLEPLDFYYVLFNSRASAAAYSLEVLRLWRLSKQEVALKTRTGTTPTTTMMAKTAAVPLKSLSSADDDGGDGGGDSEDLAQALRSFTLVLPSQRHFIRHEDYPRTPLERRRRMQGAAPGGRPWAEALAETIRPQLQRQAEPQPQPQPEQRSNDDNQHPSSSSSPSPHSPSPSPIPSPAVMSDKLTLVLLTIDGTSGGDGRATPDALRRAIQDDGVERNLAWRVVGLAENDDAGGDGMNRYRGIIPLGLGKSSTRQEDRLAEAAAASEKREKRRDQHQQKQREDEEVSNSNSTADDATVTAEASSNNDGGGSAETSTSSSSSSSSEGSGKRKEREKTKGKAKGKGESTEGGVDWRHRLHTRFLIAFADEAEARRFVRCWHRRELMLPSRQRLQQVQMLTERNKEAPVDLGEPRVVNASVLW